MIWRKVYKFLASVRLAMALLVIILVCCVIGVTIVRGVKAGALIFGTIWFNGLLVLLVINVAFCFFGRIWGRKVTIISLGMILFHLSFVAMLGGVVYNSLFYFRGVIRLTEGESLPSRDLHSYDVAEHGRFFDWAKLKGETSLLKMHVEYKVGDDKRIAYEVAVGEGARRKQGVIYVTNDLEHRGFHYFNDKEGYSVLVLLFDGKGKELYGAYVPLQSLKWKDSKNTDTYLYATGTKDGPGSIPFPQEPIASLFDLQVIYKPPVLKGGDGDVLFQVFPLHGGDAGPNAKPVAEVQAKVGKKVKTGNHYLSVSEVRFWVAMHVRYDPGKPIVLASLWVGLAGMVLTFIGRMRKHDASPYPDR